MEEEFSETEVAEILRFLGYPNWKALAQSIQLGYPAASQPMFLVLDSLKRIAPASRALVRKDLTELRCIEEQLSSARSRMKTSSIAGGGDTVRMNPAEANQLRQEIAYWTKRLADDFGVFENPYSQMSWSGLPGGLNAKVVG